MYIGNWRASEASETLFTHVYGISRYIYIFRYVRLFLIPMRASRLSVSNTHAHMSVLQMKFKS